MNKLIKELKKYLSLPCYESGFLLLLMQKTT